MFSVLTVVLTVAVGMILACLAVQWEALKGKAIYRVLLILPYAITVVYFDSDFQRTVQPRALVKST